LIVEGFDSLIIFYGLDIVVWIVWGIVIIFVV